ncbi:MAG: apolipoprotein N-acyltransferase [Actinomycetota bacterium]|nr:apolipoprotein N-acyltransferase [Actinomycetota bacterium]
MVPIALVAASSLMMWASFPPIGFGPLAIVAPIPFFIAIRGVEKASVAVMLSFGWGALFFGLLLTWLIGLGLVAWIPVWVLMGSFTAAYGFVLWVFRLWAPWRWWAIAIGGWVLMEFLRGRFPFGGFPWGDIGYPVAGLPGAVGSVQWIGPSGWTTLVVAVAAGLAIVIERRTEWKMAVDSTVVIVLVMIAGGLFAPSPSAQVWRTAIVQGGSPCPQSHCQNENQRIYESHLELTKSIPEDTVEFVVWPENSAGGQFDPETNETVRTAIAEQARRLDAYMLISGTRTVGQSEFVNFNIVYSPEGVKIGEYRKRHPVPFGEYVPLRGLLGFIPQLDQVPRDMVSGTEPVVFATEQGVLGSVISFEGAFARSMRSIARAGAESMVIATNEASFGDSAASDQLIGLARVNAAAVGLDTALGAITGKSTFITGAGSVGPRTDLFEEVVQYGSLQFRFGDQTVWVRFGDWMALLAVLGAVAVTALPGDRTAPQGGAARREF